MKNLIFILLVFIGIQSCKTKDMVEPILESDCVLINTLSPIDSTQYPYFYDDQKRLVGKVTYTNERNILSYTTAVYDTVVYNNNNVSVYSLDVLLGAVISSNNFPQHQPISNYFAKAVAEYTNGNISLINYYSFNGRVETLKYKKEIEYENDRVSIVKITGFQKLCPYSMEKTQTDYTHTYFGSDSVKIIGITKLLDGTYIGSDTLQGSFQNLKNPLARAKNLSLIFSNWSFEKVAKSEKYGYSYQFSIGNYCNGSSNFTGIFTDNGYGFPKEKGVYKCN